LRQNSVQYHGTLCKLQVDLAGRSKLRLDEKTTETHRVCEKKCGEDDPNTFVKCLI
jgi:hypothetical protein